MTCLNDRAWPLRAAFFQHIAAVGLAQVVHSVGPIA
jgi:hypothetical protein